MTEDDYGPYLAAFAIGLAVLGAVFGIINGGVPATGFEVFLIVLGAASFSAIYNAWWRGDL